MDSDVPAYLKSLEDLLSPSLTENTIEQSVEPTTEPTVNSDVVTSTVSTSLSLSNIGFGSMFTSANSSNAPAPIIGQDSSKEKVKFMLVSTHVHQFTGYAKVGHGILTELARHPWIQLTHFGFQKINEIPQGFRPYPSNIDVIDAASLEKPLQQGFGYSALPDVIRRKRPHVVMIYNDLSVVGRFMEEIRKSGIPRTFKIWVYCDQVYTMQPQMYIDVLNRDADRIFTFTQQWKQCIKDQGITRPTDVLLHGFHSNTFFPMPKELARKQLQLPNDIFIYMCMNRNQPRKRYDVLIMAFVELVVKYPTRPLYLLCVCDKGDKGGWSLFELFQRELRLRGVSLDLFGNRLIITSQNMSFKDEEVNLFYNVADVGVSASDGEGWGLCNFEQMGVGVPQVVPDLGGFKEFCSTENSVLVKPTVRYYIPNGFSPVGGEAHACTPHDFCVGMEEYLLNTEKRVEHGKEARSAVLDYTWKKSVDILLKRLETVLEDD
jgi:glycosyltransferase involved in cell wall biosynthesis